MWFDAMAWNWVGRRAIEQYQNRRPALEVPPWRLLNQFGLNMPHMAGWNTVQLNGILIWIFQQTNLRFFIDLLYRGLLERAI